MGDDLHQRAREIFLQLETLEGPELHQDLHRLVGEDAGLLAAVFSLLDAREGADAAGLMTGTESAASIRPITEAAGSIIGPYKVLQLIGEGGFGSVFLAEQAEPVRRRVALKIIKLGMDTKQVIARFEAERQALALMDHPHIARVFDAGTTDSGRPYFVMEYVVGDAINAFADAYKLDIPARLDLLAQVCSAVQHAHTKGVIHRDLKPANVLVSMVDGKPFAKVIDFGIAKATASPLTHKTLFTEHRQLIGTPEYMSPEQAEGSPDIDTRTDVYALGVLLYELLTGVTPFDGARLRSAAWLEMQRIIREEEPPMPSVRIGREMNTLAATAAARRIDPPKLSGTVRGELDWIVMRALDKDRGRRYETPAQLAKDIGRHLAGEAVVAAPPSRAYRLRKFARRNQTGVLAGSVVAAALLLGTMGAGWGMWRAHNANAKLSDQVESAKTAFGEVVDTLGWLTRGQRMTTQMEGPEGEVYGVVITRMPDRSLSIEPAGPEYADKFGDGVLYILSQIAMEQAANTQELTDAAEWSAYIANLALAQIAMDASDWPKARDYLAACPESKRGWEWEFLRRKADSVALAVPGFWSTASLTSDGTLRLFGERDRSGVTESTNTFNIKFAAEGLDSEEIDRGVLVSIESEDDRESPRSAWVSTYEDSVGIVHDWKNSFATFLPRGWGYSPRYLRHASNGCAVISVQNMYPGVQIFDEKRKALVGVYDFGEAGAQIIDISEDMRWLLAIIRPDGDSWRDRYCRAVLIDTRNAGSPIRHLGAGNKALLAVVDILGAAPAEFVQSVVLSDGSRRITAGPDREIRFFDATDGADPARQGLIVSFRVSLDVSSLHLSDDEQRLVVAFADGSAEVWDIRGPGARRLDIGREWDEREFATGYVASLLSSSDAATDVAELEQSIVADRALTPLRRYVSIDVLYESLSEITLDVIQEFDRITASQTEKDVVLAAAEMSDLEPRAMEMLLAKAKAWKPFTVSRSMTALLAEETKLRRLAEANVAIRSVDAGASIEQHDRDRAAVLEAIRVFREYRVTHDDEQYGQVFSALGTVGSRTYRYAWAESALRAGDLRMALQMALEAPHDRLTEGGARPGLSVRDALAEATPCELAVLAMIRHELAAADQEWLNAAARIDQTLLGISMDRSDSLEMALRRLRHARAIMRDPNALNDDGLPWREDLDAMSLVAEAASMIEGTVD